MSHHPRHLAPKSRKRPRATSRRVNAAVGGPAVVAVASIGALLSSSGVAGGFLDTVSSAAPVSTSVWDWRVYKDFTGVGDWDGDGQNDVVSLSPDGTLQLHRGNGNASFQTPVVMGKIDPTADGLVGFERSGEVTTPMLFWHQTTPGPSGNPVPSFTVRPQGKTGITAPVEGMNYGWSVFDSTTAVPGLLTGQSYLVGKWPRVAKSNLFGYVILADGTANTNVGVPTDHDAAPGMFGWQEWYPGDSLVGLGDWDGDGHGDLGAVLPDGIMVIYGGNGTGPMGLSQRADLGGGWEQFEKYLGGYDYTGDGRPDVLARRISDGALIIWTWLGPGLPSGGVTTH